MRGVTDLMVMPGLVNLDFADVRTVMAEMGKAMMGTGEAEGDDRAVDAAEAAISNPLLDDVSMRGARGVLINITGGFDMTLFEVDAGRQPNPRGGRRRRQHHLRLDVRSDAEGPDAGVGGRHRHHAGTAGGGCAAAGRACRRAGASRAVAGGTRSRRAGRRRRATRRCTCARCGRRSDAPGTAAGAGAPARRGGTDLLWLVKGLAFPAGDRAAGGRRPSPEPGDAGAGLVPGGAAPEELGDIPALLRRRREPA